MVFLREYDRNDSPETLCRQRIVTACFYSFWQILRICRIAPYWPGGCYHKAPLTGVFRSWTG